MNFQLDILPAAQRLFWPELAAMPRKFVLYGGTAIALQLGHRQSVDFDFFCSGALDPLALHADLPFLRDAMIVNQAPNTLTCRVTRGDSVLVTFMGTTALRQLRSPLTSPDNGCRIASLLDLAATKVSVVQQRAEAKDYLDIAALLRAGITLEQALAAAALVFGEGFDAQATLKALCFFGDGDLHTVDMRTRDELVGAAKAVDLDRLPLLGEDSSVIGA